MEAINRLVSPLLDIAWILKTKLKNRERELRPAAEAYKGLLCLHV